MSESESKGGPVRESGGTTGAGNPSAGSASRTGGATGGISPKKQSDPKPTSAEKKIPASPDNCDRCDN
ncbi:MAG: hypothetical protein JO353_07820 [Phycisphaerae bacterium]|nr:hypothetical protein [Phycisphaerae bacterium]